MADRETCETCKGRLLVDGDACPTCKPTYADLDWVFLPVEIDRTNADLAAVKHLLPWASDG